MSGFDDLVDAVSENLRVRGVHSRLLAALEAEIASALRPLPPRAPPQSPDGHLMEALVSDYLESRGLASTLSVFCLETGARGRSPGATPGAALSPPGAPAPPTAAAVGSSLAERAAASLLREASAALARCAAAAPAPPGGAPEDAAAAVRELAALLAPAAPPGAGSGAPLPHLPPGVAAVELGLPAVRSPLLLEVVRRMREEAARGAVAVPGWLGEHLGSREEAAAAYRAIAAAHERAVAAAAAGGRGCSSDGGDGSAPAGERGEEGLPPFDSDEDVPGVLRKVAAAAGGAAGRARAAAAAAAAAHRFFDTITSGGAGLLLEGDA
jgi:hypothetical protein